MDKSQLDKIVSGKLKMIRIEHHYTQEKMAEVLGLSKKTLIQIEKERNPAGWTNVVAVCALFRDSEVLKTALGDDPLEIIKAVAYESVAHPKSRTLGGKVWWQDLSQQGQLRLQQNVISHHYRILDNDDYRWFSSFDEQQSRQRLEELSKQAAESPLMES